MIVNNDGIDTVNGQFSTIHANNQPAGSVAEVDYAGGDGNDVVVTLALIDEVTVPGLNSDTVTFRVAGEVLSEPTIEAVGENRPYRILTTPFGKISVNVTSTADGWVTLRLLFSEPLPVEFSVFGVDLADNYSLIPEEIGTDGFWLKIDGNTLDLTVRDNGLFDLDDTLGSVNAPVVIATVHYTNLLFHILPAIHEAGKRD